MTQVLIDTKVVKNALAAVDKFCLKVQTGQAKSVETYHDLMSVGNDLRAALANAERVEPEPKLWLWKNFVDDKQEYWVFDNLYPININDDDPQTLGDPCGYALFKPSRNGRKDTQ